MLSRAIYMILDIYQVTDISILLNNIPSKNRINYPFLVCLTDL